jgi:4-nitrophenyl phosphatase
VIVLDLQSFTTVLLDMDGVIYRGPQLLAGAVELIAFFQHHGIRFACITNSSTRTPDEHATRLRRDGVFVHDQHIMTSAQATRQQLDAQWPPRTPIYALGTPALHTALFNDGVFVPDSQAPQVVVVGHSPQFSYEACCLAARAIIAGAAFIGTNPDVTVPATQGLVPECGALLAYLQAATGVAPTISGKPAPTMFHQALARCGGEPARTLVIGDRLDTDIAGARAAGLATALVLTGVTTPAMLAATALQPDQVFTDLPQLLMTWGLRDRPS